MQRRGIALLITIAFITAIAALIGIAGTIIDRAFTETARQATLVQSNIVLSNIQTLLNRNTKDINDSSTLDVLLSLPLFFGDPQAGIMTDLSFVSDASAVNVNLLVDKAAGTSGDAYAPLPLRAAYQTYFERIFQFYRVSDGELLMAMIADTIDSDLNERLPGTEITLQNPDFTQGQIFDLRQFGRILDAYKRQTMDFSVDAVPWQTLIGFRNESIDFNHITADALHFIAPDIDDKTLVELTTDRVDVYEQFTGLPLSEEDLKMLKEMNVEFYSPLITGKLHVMGDKQKVAYTFAYDLSTQKASQFAIAY